MVSQWITSDVDASFAMTELIDGEKRSQMIGKRHGRDAGYDDGSQDNSWSSGPLGQNMTVLLCLSLSLSVCACVCVCAPVSLCLSLSLYICVCACVRVCVSEYMYACDGVSESVC
jgi:hypothetical protein